MQTIHMAEEKYSGGVESKEHSATYWGNKGLVNTDDGYDQTDAAESWIIGNVTGEATPGIGDSRFPGGFAGKCDTAEAWVFEGGAWTCSGGPSWTQGVILPSTTHTGDTGHIGLIVMPFNWKNVPELKINQDFGMNSWRQAYGQFNSITPISDVSDSWNLTSATVTCHPADSFTLTMDDEMKPKESSAEKGVDYFRKTATFDASTRDKPLAVTGDVALKDNTTYRCAWEYGTNGEGDVENVGTSPKLIQNDPDAADHFTNKYDGLKTSYDAGGLKDYSQNH